MALFSEIFCLNELACIATLDSFSILLTEILEMSQAAFDHIYSNMQVVLSR